MLEEVAKDKNKIRITSESGVRERVFACDVAEFKIIDNKIIVLVNMLNKQPQAENKNCNVFCLDENAEILWQIQKPEAGFRFTGLRVMGSGVVRVFKNGARLTDLRVERTSILPRDTCNSDYLDIEIASGKFVHA